MSKLSEEEKKARKKARGKAYREAHRDKLKEKGKIYRDATKEKRKIQAKTYRIANKGKIRTYKKAYYAVNRVRASVVMRRNHLKRKFNLTVEDYDRMLVDQQGRCKICGRMPKKRRLHIDHNHQTKEVRALLCCQCNQMIGSAKENATVLKLAALYIEGHNQ